MNFLAFILGVLIPICLAMGFAAGNEWLDGVDRDYLEYFLFTLIALMIVIPIIVIPYIVGRVLLNRYDQINYISFGLGGGILAFMLLILIDYFLDSYHPYFLTPEEIAADVPGITLEQLPILFALSLLGVFGGIVCRRLETKFSAFEKM